MKTEHLKTTTGSASPSQGSGPPAYDIESIAIKQTNIPRGRAAWLGGPTTKIGDRIAPPVADASGLQGIDVSDGNINGQDILNKQLSAEVGATIQYRTCSWPKTAGLLFSEYICLAIMSFPMSYSTLGLIPGIILTVIQALLVVYTSLIMWEFCLRHPEVRDVCDVGQVLFWGKKWAWYATAVMFILNNTFIQGLHVLIGAEYLNTMVGPEAGLGCQTVVFAIITTIVCWIGSMPRTFDMMAKIGTASAGFTFLSVILATIFAAIEAHPAGYSPVPLDDPTAPFGEPVVRATLLPGTTFVAGMNAFLNIAYTFIGQITLPSFIAEMKDPRDFPKALWACSIMGIITYTIVGAVVYASVGDQYMTSPAFGSIGDEIYKKVSFTFMVPTLVFLGCLYASVSARFIFFRIFQNSRHKSEHTIIGWTTWGGILLVLWIISFVIANSIPFFSSLLSLMSSVFGSFFGFIFWGIAYFRMRRVDGATPVKQDRSFRGWWEGALNILIIVIGLVFLGPGTYVTVQSIMDSFAEGSVRGVFSCASNGV